MKNIEFKDMTVKEAVKDLEIIFNLDRMWKKSMERHYNDPINYLPFDAIEKIAELVSSALTYYWIADMSKFDNEGQEFYKNYCKKNGIPWLEYRKFFSNGRNYTLFARHHIGELAMLYGYFDDLLLIHKGDKDVFKKFSTKTPEKRIGPFVVDKGGDYDFAEELQAYLVPYLNEYYAYGRHIFVTDEVFEDIKKDILRIIVEVEKENATVGGRVVF